MFGLTGVLIALIVLTIVLAGVFLVRPSITVGATGKILAFIGLCVLPALCIGTGMSFHIQRSEQTRYCISCHSMESHGKSLYVLNPSYIPAQHFQNHFVPPDKACYTCHTDYTMYGPLKDKLKGLRYLYMEYVSTPPKIIHLDGTYSNLQCLHCHAGARDFEENLARMPPLASLESNQISCISSGCHDTIHNVSEVDHLKMWTGGVAPTVLATGSSSPSPVKAKATAAAGAPKTTSAAAHPPSGSASPASAKAEPTATAAPSAAGGKAIFDSHGCSGCHGAAGGGGSGPALTHISIQYPPAKLTVVLKAPTAKMKAAGMVPLTLSAADMKSLVSYVTSLGGTSAAPAAASPAAGSTSPAPAKAKAGATAAPAKATTGSTASAATAAGGKGIFDSQHCSTCHGVSGGGGAGPALTHISSQYPPAQLTAVLKAPTAKMKAAGMVPLTLNTADMKALVSYVTSLGGTSATSAATPPAAGSPSPAPGKAGPTAKAAPSEEESKGKVIFQAHGCADCHGTDGVGGTAAASALAGTGAGFPPALLTRMLQHPTARMQQGGMPPVSLSSDDLKALVAYVSYISASKGNPQ